MASPYVSSIADLMQAGARARAEGARQAANAQAIALARNGENTAYTIGAVGNAAASTIGGIFQAKADRKHQADADAMAQRFGAMVRQGATPADVMAAFPAGVGERFVGLMKSMQPPGPEPMEVDPTKDVIDKRTGAVLRPGVPAPTAQPKAPDAGTFGDYLGRIAQGKGTTVGALSPADVTAARTDWEAAGRPAKETPTATPGSFDDYLTRKYGANPTPDQIIAGRKAYQQADDRPTGAAAQSTPPGDWTKEGDEFLQTIPVQWRSTVKKIARYDEDATKVASMRGGNREQLMQWVNQVNPAYDASTFSNRAPTRKAFTTGTQGQQINAINTALGHLDQLTALADPLQNGGFVPGNKAWNTLRTMFGGDTVTNFDTLKDALAGEVSSVLSKSGATVSGIADAKEKIHAASSPTQLAGYVKTLIPVMGSKLASLDFQFHQAMGENDSFSALSPESKRILEKFGFDPAHPTIGGTPPAKPNTIRARDPQGVLHEAEAGTALPAGWKAEP